MMKNRILAMVILSIGFFAVVAQESIIVDNQAIIDTNNDYIMIGDLAGGDGLRKLVFRSWDQDRIWVDEYGRVGIGTPSPDANLTIGGADLITYSLKLKDQLGRSLEFISPTASSPYGRVKISGTSADLRFGVDSYPEQINILGSNGNVGVGTTTPGDKLEISGGGLRFQRIPTPLTNTGAYGQIFQLTNLVGTSDGLVYQADLHQFRNYDGTPELTVKDGNFGIGTTTPNDRLEIANGGLRFQRIPTPLTNSTGTYGQIFQLTNLVGTSDGLVFQSDLHQFRNWDGTPELTIKDGNLGIGTTTPSEKLSVNGTIRSKEVKVEASPWPDYVFEEGYKLRSLEETKAYIDTHKHLPEVPSAQEIEENGVALGEMNMLLLKKIEELTLHQIELLTEIKNLKSEINQLKNEK